MSTPKDGGPAFPHEGGNDSQLYANPGMSLREWLTGHALAGMCANKELAGASSKLIARWSVECAEDTLALLAKEAP